jgi:hypothetical protein
MSALFTEEGELKEATSRWLDPTNEQDMVDLYNRFFPDPSVKTVELAAHNIGQAEKANLVKWAMELGLVGFGGEVEKGEQKVYIYERIY